MLTTQKRFQIHLDQFRCIKIQPQTIHRRRGFLGINPTNSVFIAQSLVLRSEFYYIEIGLLTRFAFVLVQKFEAVPHEWKPFPYPSDIQQRYNEYLSILVFSVCTVSYGSSFLSLRFMARALRAWAINQRGKYSVRNLRYRPQTRLVRGISCQGHSSPRVIMSSSRALCCFPSVKNMTSIFFRSMYNKTNIRFGFCNIQKSQGLGKGYQPQPSASDDNPYLDLDHSGYHKKPHPIIDYYQQIACPNNPPNALTALIKPVNKKKKQTNGKTRGTQ